MKATGVVRRIDELGRVVVPKEIRRTLKIKNGTPLEIFCGDSGELILKKYSPIVEIGEILNEVCESIQNATNKNVMAINHESVVAYFGAKKSEYINRAVDSHLEKLVEARRLQIVDMREEKIMLFLGTNVKNFVIAPILTNGDVYGALLVFDDESYITEDIKLVAGSFANYLGRQIE